MSIEIKFTGKKVLVTGGGNGIGRELCRKLHKQNAIVYALDVNKDALKSLETECPGIKSICVDLQDWNATRKAVSAIGPINALVNNAGIALKEDFMSITPENFDKVININLKQIVNVSQVVVQGMIDTKQGGSIVNISSLASKCGTRQCVVYNLTKAAVDSLTKAMAVELGPKNIRVNSVNPVFVNTDIIKPFLGTPEGQQLREKLVSRIPMGRICEVGEVANTILFLLSDLAPMIQGEQIFIDGAYSAA